MIGRVLPSCINKSWRTNEKVIFTGRLGRYGSSFSNPPQNKFLLRSMWINRVFHTGPDVLSASFAAWEIVQSMAQSSQRAEVFFAGTMNSKWPGWCNRWQGESEAWALSTANLDRMLLPDNLRLACAFWFGRPQANHYKGAAHVSPGPPPGFKLTPEKSPSSTSNCLAIVSNFAAKTVRALFSANRFWKNQHR